MVNTAKPNLLRTFVTPAMSLCRREIVRFYRYPSRVIGALGTPMVFWLLIGSGIGTSFRLPGTGGEMNYLEYFFPGSLLLILLFTSIFTMMSVIEDRHEGFLLSALVAPIPRSALVVGKVLGGAILAAVQGMLFLLIAPFAGVSLGMAQILLVATTVFLISVGLTALGFVFAWQLDSTQGFHGIVNLFLVPLWLLSGSLFPPGGASSWIRWTMMLNPLTYANAALRRSLYLGQAVPPGTPSLSNALAVTLLFTGLVLLTAFVLAGRPARGNLG